jgi:DNA-3-methyladenine glycosylase
VVRATAKAEPIAAELRRPLPREFYAVPTVELAQALIGMLVVSEDEGGLSAAAIVEAEAYAGPADRASHARAGRTRRTEPMFGPPGHAYVYLVYGMHECLNVVAERDGEAGAVLLRAAQPLVGIELMRMRRSRPADPDHRLASGPARLAQALGVDRRLDRHDLTSGTRLWLARSSGLPAPAPSSLASGPRIGVAYAGEEWAAVPWRFWLSGHPAVSR